MLHVDEADSIVSNVINIHWHFFFSSDIRPICNQTFMASFLRFTINFVTFSFQGEHKITSHWMNRLCEYDSIIKRKKSRNIEGVKFYHEFLISKRCYQMFIWTKDRFDSGTERKFPTIKFVLQIRFIKISSLLFGNTHYFVKIFWLFDIKCNHIVLY